MREDSDNGRPHAREPQRWRVSCQPGLGYTAAALEELAEPIAQCKAGASGTFTATAYVGTILRPASPEDKKGEPAEIGKIMAVDVIPPDKEGVGAVDCLVKALRSGTYPSPGQRPAKVTFLL